MANRLKYLLLINLAFILIFFCTKQRYFEDYVAKVDGELISVSEFRNMMQKNRAMIYNYFYELYRAEDHETFWITKYGNEIPIERLKKISLDECIRIKVEQILAKEKKIVDDISYSTFYERYRKENENRKQALIAKKVVFGPIDFNEQTYFNYIFSNMVLKLKERLAETEFALNDSDIRAYYKEHQEDYKLQDSIIVKKISVCFYYPDSAISLMSKSEAKSTIEKIYADISKRNDFPSEKNCGDFRISLKEQIFDHSTAFIDDRLYSQLKKAAIDLQVNEISPIIEDELGFHILKCIKRKKDGYISFEEIRDNIRSKLIDEKYEQLIDKLVKEANIELNNSSYNAIKEI